MHPAESPLRFPSMARALLLTTACALAGACNAVAPDSSDGPERDTSTQDASDAAGVTRDIAAADAADDAEPADVGGEDSEPSDTLPSDTTQDDASASDVRDSGAPDSGNTDIGGSDSGGSDSGTPDTGTSDTGTTDTGNTDTDTGTSDTGTSDTGTPDVGGDCDLDFDGALAESCGGLDCDDTNPLIAPDVLERCDFQDNNCDGNVNESLDCRVYAHSDTQLYLVDPFLGTLEELGSVPNLFDLDTAPDGTVFGVTSARALQRFDGVAWSLVAATGVTVNLNGFAIDGFGQAYGTGGTSLFSIDTATGSSTTISSTTGYTSSGDCVVDKNDVLFMTASGGGSDDLVTLDTTSGAGRLIGSVGFSGVYGLTATYGFMFGFTGSGDVIEIDPNTGAGRLLHNHPGVSFYGAASSSTR